jgi:hypothetical protein
MFPIAEICGRGRRLIAAASAQSKATSVARGLFFSLTDRRGWNSRPLDTSGNRIPSRSVDLRVGV